MRQLFRSGVLALLVCMAFLDAKAQDARLSGFIIDRSNGQPLELVNIVLQTPDGSVRGGTSNADGLYLITGLSPSRYVFQVSYVGYETYVDTVALGADETRTFNVALEPASETLDEVVVETERTGAARVTAGQQTIRPADLESIPSPDVSGDLAGYLAAQPGVVSTGDRGGQFFIRGGEPSQNLVQVDGILLYQPFHVLGFYSAFPSEIINKVDVYAGGYGSRFGDKISSVIDVATRTGNNRQTVGTASVSPFLSSVVVEGPLYRDRASLLVSVRRSNIEQGAARYIDDSMPFEFGDAFAKLHTVITDNSRASVTAMKTFDRGTLTEAGGGVPVEEIRWNNDAIGLRLLMLPKIVPIMADLHVSYSRLLTELGSADNPSRNSEIANTHVALDATYFGDRIDAEAGSSLRVTEIQSELGGIYQNLEFHSAVVSHWGSYLGFDVDAGSGLSIRPGVRATFYKVRFNPFFEPRLKIVWERGRHQISSAFGIYHQEIIGLSDQRDAASVFTVWTNIRRVNPNIPGVLQGRIQKATHAILGYRAAAFSWLEFSVEGFYKDLDNLFVPEWTAFPRFTTRMHPAVGRSFGADLRVEVRQPNFYGYVTYGLSSTRYTLLAENVIIWYGGETPDFRPSHDRRHQLNVVGSTSLLGFGVNVRWEFGSGLPFSRAIGFDGFVLLDDVVRASEVTGRRRVIYERRFNAVLPTYHRLDVSVDRTFSFRRADVTVQGSVINAYDRRNLFYLDVFTHNRVDQLPLVPSLGLKIAFN